MPSFYWFAYYQAQRDLRLETRPMETQIHKVRDGLISGTLFATLCQLGYQYGCTIINFPESVSKEMQGRNCLRKSELQLRADDLILLTTRPPLDDQDDEVSIRFGNATQPTPVGDLPFRGRLKQATPKRRIERSGNVIEAAIFASLRQLFTKCSREMIRLSDDVRFRGKDLWFREVHFRQSQGGAVHYFADRGDRLIPEPVTSDDGLLRGTLTVGYFIYVASLGKSCPAQLIAAFGAGGTETMLFGTVLRDYQPLTTILQRTLRGSTSRLVMCTFLVPAHIPYPFLVYEVKDLDPKIIVDQEVTILPTA